MVGNKNGGEQIFGGESMGDSFEGAQKTVVAKPKAGEDVYIAIDRQRFVRAFTANCFLGEVGKAHEVGLDAVTLKFLGMLSNKTRFRDARLELPREVMEKLSSIEPVVDRAVKAARHFATSEVIELASIRAVDELAGIGLKKEEASYLVGKALIDMGLKEPMQKMLSFSGTDAELINAFMVKMRAIAYAKERTEKAEGDIKRVLAEHNVTERKYEAA